MSNENIKLTLKSIADQNFVDALRKLGGDVALDATERYALARAIKGVTSELETFEEVRKATIEKHGKKVSELAKERLANLKRIAGDKVDDKLYGPAIKKIESDILSLELNPSADGFQVDENDVATFKAFKAEIDELLKREVVLFLNHKIKLPKTIGIDANAMVHLLDLIEPA